MVNRYSVLILGSLIVNIVMLQLTLHHYFALEMTYVAVYSSIAILSALVSTIAFLRWWKKEKAQYDR